MIVEKDVHTLLSNAEPNIHYEFNRDKEVIYPYCTYTLTRELGVAHSEIYTIDIQIFDHSTSMQKLYEVSNRIKGYLNQKIEKTVNGYYSYVFMRSNTVPTADETIQRLDMQFQVTVNLFEPDTLKIGKKNEVR